jgi:hypothetical protein
MSHIAVLEMAFRDLSALEAACAAVGATLDQAARKYAAYYGQQKCNAGAITHPAANFGIGVNKEADGSYRLAWDNWNIGMWAGGLPEVFGADLTKLRQGYSSIVASRQMRRAGFRVQETRDEQTGDLRLICTR